MKKSLLTLALATVAATGCTDLVGEEIIYGRGPVITEQRTTGAFTSISNATSARVEILQGTQDRAFVQAQDNILPYLRTRVEGGVLRIYTDREVMLQPSAPIVVGIDVRELNRIVNSGSGLIHAPLVDARRLEVVSSGSGNVELPSLLADSIIIQLSGSGDVTSTGNVLRLRVVHSGSGRVDTRELAARRVDATLSGSGNAFVRARDELNATISGSGSVRYYGSPDVRQTVTGSGRVERAGS
jgi:hypothetical protein